MPSLISLTERAILTGIFADIFDTFSRSILIHKAPLETQQVVSQSDFVFGFGTSQELNAAAFTPVNAWYMAVVRYSDHQGNPVNAEMFALIPNGTVTIKVKKDCRDYINAGKTERIEFDNRSFVLLDDERKQTFLDSEFWVFRLEARR